MNLWGVGFDRPGYLVLLVLLPLLWWWSYRSLSGLGKLQRFFALTLRSLVLALIVLALAEVQWVRQSDRVAVIYLVDRSLSIGADRLPDIIDYVNQETAEHLDARRSDCAGLISFGKDAAVEIPPYPAPITLMSRFETEVDRQHTNLAGALKMAMVMFPADASKRIVILTDGNENIASAREQARSVVEAGIGIDVVPLASAPRSDVLVDKVTVPAHAREGLAFDVKVALQVVPSPIDPHAQVPGLVTVIRRAGDHQQILSEQHVVLPPGKTVLQLRDELTTANFYTYEAKFVADDPAQNARSQNDRASSFVQVAGKAQVLLIHDSSRPTEFSYLCERLKAAEIEVTLQSSNQLFTNLADLQRFDAVVLANIARSAGDDAENLQAFSDAQIEMLVRNTEELGAGLVMLGGPESFGAGGWTGTRLEEAMPVDFQVKNSRVMAVGALALVIDKSGSMQGEKIQMCRAAAIAAAKQLGRQDYLGVIAFDGAPRWMVKIAKVNNVELISKRIARLDADGGTDMFPAMREAHIALKNVNASVKHMIVLTDGQTQPADFRSLVERMKRDNITVTSVAIGTDAARPLLTEIANSGGGKYYQVTNPKAIPSIFMREARRVAKPLIIEDPNGIGMRIEFPHEILGSIDQLPAASGFVLTTPKDNPLVEIAATANRPEQPPLLATWTYGQGRAAVWTTDVGQRWAAPYTQWQHYDQLFTQLVRWSLRPTVGDRNYSLVTQVHDDRVQVIVNAIDSDGQFINSLDMTGVAIDDGGQPIALQLRQTAPGRYIGEFQVPVSGNYFVALQPGSGAGLLRAGISVPYSAEFQSRETNLALLKSLAALAPPDGQPGKVIELPQGGVKDVSATNSFRRDLPPALSLQAIWHLALLLLGVLFLCDVFNRRVMIDASWLEPIQRRLRSWRQPSDEPATPALARLQSTKSQVRAAQSAPSSAWRFEPVAEAASGASTVATENTPTSTLAPDIDYTSRLKAAKQQAAGRRQEEGK
jgi:Mg-chelatase subunit ChlD